MEVGAAAIRVLAPVALGAEGESESPAARYRLTLESTPGCTLLIQGEWMSSCCAVAAEATSGREYCPASGTKGRPVELQTVKALLTEEALRRLTPAPHRFCPEPTCDIVYFDDRGHTYVKVDLRVPVWHKEPFGARMICYCFGENEADMRAEIETIGSSHTVERVRRHIVAGRCACEVRNPRGVCCLGDLAAAVERVAVALAQRGEARA